MRERLEKELEEMKPFYTITTNGKEELIFNVSYGIKQAQIEELLKNPRYKGYKPASLSEEKKEEPPISIPNPHFLQKSINFVELRVAVKVG